MVWSQVEPYTIVCAMGFASVLLIKLVFHCVSLGQAHTEAETVSFVALSHCD